MAAWQTVKVYEPQKTQMNTDKKDGCYPCHRGPMSTEPEDLVFHRRTEPWVCRFFAKSPDAFARGGNILSAGASRISLRLLHPTPSFTMDRIANPALF